MSYKDSEVTFLFGTDQETSADTTGTVNSIFFFIRNNEIGNLKKQ